MRDDQLERSALAAELSTLAAAHDGDVESRVLEGRDSEVAVRSMRASLTAAQTEKAALSSALHDAKADAQSAVASARKSGFAAGRRSR